MSVPRSRRKEETAQTQNAPGPKSRSENERKRLNFKKLLFLLPKMIDFEDFEEFLAWLSNLCRKPESGLWKNFNESRAAALKVQRID